MFSSARYYARLNPGGPRKFLFQWWGVNAATFSWGSVSQSQGPLGDRSPEKPRRQEAGEKKKKNGGCTDAGLPSPATQHRSRCPALPQLLSREVPNKPWEGQRRAGGGGEREVTELENLE